MTGPMRPYSPRSPRGDGKSTSRPAPDRSAGSPFADLPDRPVVEHVACFEVEHDRLVRELRAVDEL